MIASRNGCCGTRLLFWNHLLKSVAMIYPGAFNTTTGPLHWKLLARARAVDNQMYVALCSPARIETASYQAYGHSMVVDPKGTVLVEAETQGTIVYADLEPEQMQADRMSIPVTIQRRFDVYSEVSGNVSTKAT